MKNSGLVFKTIIECEFLGELEAKVYFDYLPEEPEVLYPVDEAHPGCCEEADIIDVVVVINGPEESIMEKVPEIHLDELAERAIAWFNEQGDEDRS